MLKELGIAVDVDELEEEDPNSCKVPKLMEPACLSEISADMLAQHEPLIVPTKTRPKGKKRTVKKATASSTKKKKKASFFCHHKFSSMQKRLKASLMKEKKEKKKKTKNKKTTSLQKLSQMDLLPNFKLDIKSLNTPQEALPQHRSSGAANYTIQSPTGNGAKVEVQCRNRNFRAMAHSKQVPFADGAQRHIGWGRSDGIAGAWATVKEIVGWHEL